MNKLKNILIGLVTAISLTSAAYAGSFGFGVTGSYTKIEAEGTETVSAGTLGTAQTSAKKAVDNNAFLGSVYAEYNFNDATWANSGNSVTIGARLTPGSADVSDRVQSRTDSSSGADVASEADTGTYKAQAEVDNYINYYVEIPVWKSLYIKAGMSTIDVTTLESATGTTIGSYGNKTLDGTNLGVGFKGLAGTNSNIVWKVAYEQTDFDTLNLTSTTSNTIKADLDTSEFNLSLGYRF